MTGYLIILTQHFLSNSEISFRVKLKCLFIYTTLYRRINKSYQFFCISFMKNPTLTFVDCVYLPAYTYVDASLAIPAAIGAIFILDS
jgi:hypothetical protein